MDHLFWNAWAIAHRNAKAWMMVVALLGLLAWALSESGVEMVERKEITVEVLEVFGDSDSRGRALPVARIRLPSGKETRILLGPQPPLPNVGDRLPAVYERYDDGRVFIAVDRAY